MRISREDSAAAESIALLIAVTFLVLAVIGAIDVIHTINAIVERQFAQILHWGCLP